MKKIAKILTVALMVFGMISCSGDDGEIGPQGPQGEQGVQGDQGTQGEQGEPGTANVIYSAWMPVNFLVGGAQQTNLMGLDVFNSSEFNIDTDVALVYGRRNSGANAGVYTLPFTLHSQNEYYYYVLAEVTGGIGLQLRVTTTDGGSNLFTFFDEYRYVIIPGGVAASGKSSSKGGVQSTIDYTKMTYEEITQLFNIQ
ncbi:hypothetical protein ACQY1Q_05430 [Tenacibaculum sp. TC6]|uniref:hypothetical protein n=1 Tax=Tenacibaculum sp. TC6 TaxID=3423223 RepID=UPI003D36EDAF